MFEYTAEMTADIVDRYQEAVQSGADYTARTALVKEIADELQTTEASVRSKLVSEKVYVAKERAATAKDSKSKEEYVKALRAVTGLDLRSAEKMTKTDIVGIFEFIKTASAQRETV